MKTTCHFCKIDLNDKNHSMNEHVETDADKGDVEPICDGCYTEAYHKQAKEWCEKNLRVIERPDAPCKHCNQQPNEMNHR